MRTRVSEKKRMVIIAVSLIFTVAAIILVVLKLQPYTKSLHEDISKANVFCTQVTVLSDGSLPPESLISAEELAAIAAGNKNVCAVNLEYTFYSNIPESLSDFSVDVRSGESALGKVYACSDISLISDLNNEYKMLQTIVVDRTDVRKSYFEEELPKSFKAPFLYEFSYRVDGTDAVKTIGFTTGGKL